MKHAYLIMAHHEPEVLQLLLKALDERRNDVFIHFVRKCEAVADIMMKKARTFVLGNSGNKSKGMIQWTNSIEGANVILQHIQLKEEGHDC